MNVFHVQMERILLEMLVFQNVIPVHLSVLAQGFRTTTKFCVLQVPTALVVLMLSAKHVPSAHTPYLHLNTVNSVVMVSMSKISSVNNVHRDMLEQQAFVMNVIMVNIKMKQTA